jgi:Ca2+:H+ antiporter
MPTTFAAVGPSQRLALAGAFFFTAAAGAVTAAGAPDVARFVVSGLALAALAALVGQSIEQIGERVGPGPTGLIQSSLGNLPELFVAVFALRAGLSTVVQAALVGSVLGNVLLVLGAAFLTGGARHGPQSFQPEAPRMLVTLLTLAVGATLVPTLAVRLDTPAVHHAAGLSDVTAIVLLLVYLGSIPFWLSGGPELCGPDGRARAGKATRGGQQQGPEADGDCVPVAASPSAGQQWPLGLAVVILVVAGLASAFVSDWFVAALTPATHSLGLSRVFTGLVVVAIASNAVENAVGIRFAWKARPDFAISTILNSPLQITLFLTPVLVLSSHFYGPSQLTLVFPLLLVAALAVAVVVVGVTLYDGEYSWLEGVALIALYVIIAASFWWG